MVQLFSRDWLLIWLRNYYSEDGLLRYEIAMREQSEDGPYLIFPSQSTRENPDIVDPEGKALSFDFEGPVLNIYNALTVRLSHSGLFKKKELWKNAVIYSAKAGGTCGILLHNTGEGRGKLTLFFDRIVGEETRFYFEEYIWTQLQRRAIRESIRRQRIFICPECGTPIMEIQVERRRKRGYKSIQCNVCDAEVSLLDREERLAGFNAPFIAKMDSEADKQREHEKDAIILQGKKAVNDFDVFLCYNNEDTSRVRVKTIGEQLKAYGILPWLDIWEMRPGLPWQRMLEQQIENIKAAAVCIGKNGVGPWQQLEIEAFLRKFVKLGRPVIPVLLPDAPKEPQLPTFLESMAWVDFRHANPDPLKQLIWGITGERDLNIKY